MSLENLEKRVQIEKAGNKLKNKDKEEDEKNASSKHSSQNVRDS